MRRKQTRAANKSPRKTDHPENPQETANPVTETVSAPLPEPVSVPEVATAETVTAEEKPGMLAGLFGKSAGSSEVSPTHSIPSSTEPLPADAERKLDAVPDVIGELGDAEPGETIIEAEDTDDLAEVVALLDGLGFAEDDMRDFVTECGEWLALRFKSDHWKLSERQAKLLARPYTACANSAWHKLLEFLPGFLRELMARSPEAAAAVIATGIVFVPKGLKQLKVSAERKRQSKRDADPRRVDVVRDSVAVPDALEAGRSAAGGSAISPVEDAEDFSFPTERIA